MNYNTLIIGDLHAMPSNMEDTGLILDLVVANVDVNPHIQNVIFLGDIFHTHSVVRQEVAHFVKEKILEIANSSCVRIFLMAGNHDGSSPHSVKENAVRLVFNDVDPNIIIVDDENFVHRNNLEDNFVLVPFIGNSDKFVSAVQQDAEILFCHQTVIGAHYENKHLASGGVDQDLLPQPLVIAGHIHMEQTVGKVWYPGTPRALNANECNHKKGIWFFDTVTKAREKISTDHLVKVFIRYDIEEGKPVPDGLLEMAWKPKDDVSVYVTGSDTFYDSIVEQYGKQLEGKARFVPNIKKDLSGGIDVEADGENMYSALHKYVFKVYDADANSKGKIWRKLQDLIPNLGEQV